MSILSIKNIKKSYGDKEVLKGVSLDINENEIFGIIGLNGIGKTTLIKVILNLLDSDEGEISVCGENNKNCASRENLSYLPEKFQPSTYLTALEFLKIFISKNDFNLEKIYELCDAIGFDKKALKEKMSNYSKGMLQKIGLINAVLENKKLIILDEPMSGLDPKSRIFLKNVLLDYKKNGKSVFFSSHILSDIDELCDKIAILNDGVIKFVGKPKEFKEKHNEISLERAFLKEISQ